MQADPPSGLAKCNPMMDPDYPCWTPKKGLMQLEKDPPSAIPQCNPLMDPDYPCRTGVKKTLA